MNIYPELDLAWNALKAQNILYQPTAFWGEACSQIYQELIEGGISSFRKHKTALSFFVPTYGIPGNSFIPEAVQNIRKALKEAAPQGHKAELALDYYLNGEFAALSDYRVLLASDSRGLKPYLHLFSESKFGDPREQFTFEDRNFSRSSLNYLLGLALLKKNLGKEKVNNFLEIGGGFGSLGEIIASTGISSWRYIDIDIPPVSFIAYRYLSAALQGTQIAGYSDTKSQPKIYISSLPPASVLCSWQIEDLVGEIDVFVNFISFQEMEPSVVANYLGHVDRLKARWILLRNMREGKQVRKGAGSIGVEKPIKSNDYLELLPKYKLIDRNVLPYGFKTVDGFNSELLLLKRFE